MARGRADRARRPPPPRREGRWCRRPPAQCRAVRAIGLAIDPDAAGQLVVAGAGEARRAPRRGVRRCARPQHAGRAQCHLPGDLRDLPRRLALAEDHLRVPAAEALAVMVDLGEPEVLKGSDLRSPKAPSTVCLPLATRARSDRTESSSNIASPPALYARLHGSQCGKLGVDGRTRGAGYTGRQDAR